jgi:TPR repeat protein
MFSSLLRKQRLPRLAGIFAGFSFALATHGQAAQIPVDFAPPQIAPSSLCAAQTNIDKIISRAQSWPTVDASSVNPEQMLSDIQALRDLDPEGYFDLAETGFAILASNASSALVERALVDRIRYYVAAKKQPELLALGLVDKLEAGGASLSSRALDMLADAYLDGLGVAQNLERGEAYLLAAATRGSSDALLRAAKMRSEGLLAQYKLDPRTAVTLAFGAILGEVDPGICSRIGRIARYYSAGDIVKQDYGLAERWLRVAADLGDPLAAWKVARFHLSSELIKKDNTVLLKYLRQAADHGVPQAEVELGEVYENGSLAPLDLDKAEALYQSAAGRGYRLGHVRLVGLLEHRPDNPDAASRLEAALRSLTARTDAPASAFTKLAQIILAGRGRWAGEDEATALLEKSVELKSADGALMLAELTMGKTNTGGAFDRAVTLLNFAVSDGGKSNGMFALRDAYMCFGPQAPQLELAEVWRKNALAAGNATVATLTSGQSDVEQGALVQSQALSGQAGLTARFFDMLSKENIGPEVKAFWQSRVEQDPEAENALAKLLMAAGNNASAVELSIKLLESAARSGSDAARNTLANVLLQERSGPEVTGRAIDLLTESASHGSGAAILRLADLEKTPIQSEFAHFAIAVEDRGDLDAMLLAAQLSPAQADRTAYLARALRVASCSFNDVLKLARAHMVAKDENSAAHWLGIATHLTGEKGWQYKALADEYATIGKLKYQGQILPLLEDAVRYGQFSALQSLLEMRADPASSAYDLARTVSLIQKAATVATPSQLVDLARRIDKTRAAVRVQILKSVKIDAFYRKSAEAGDPQGMREWAKYLQQTARTHAQLTEAMDWMERAADKGDPEAMLLLAKAYTLGIGREASLDRAVDLLKTASGKGNKDASKMLKAMDGLQSSRTLAR